LSLQRIFAGEELAQLLLTPSPDTNGDRVDSAELTARRKDDSPFPVLV